MMEIIRNGGLGNGGTNFDAKIRRNSTDLEDLFIAHISGMDAMARALMNAADILENSELPAMKKARYASFDSGIGKDFEDGKLTFEQAYEYGKKVGEPKQTSGKQEKYETIVALYAKLSPSLYIIRYSQKRQTSGPPLFSFFSPRRELK
jgi:xylose isomerase